MPLSIQHQADSAGDKAVSLITDNGGTNVAAAFKGANKATQNGDTVADLAITLDGETVTLTAKRRMMTPEQVADAMGVSRPTISRKIKAGEIRAVKVGNRNRIPYEEFERYWRKTMGDLVELTRDELRDDLFGDQ